MKHVLCNEANELTSTSGDAKINLPIVRLSKTFIEHVTQTKRGQSNPNSLNASTTFLLFKIAKSNNKSDLIWQKATSF